MLKFCKLIFLIPFLFSCSVISFEEFKISSNISDNEQDFFQEHIILEFNITPDFSSLEDNLTFKMNGSTITYNKKIDSNKIYLQPKDGWYKNNEYKIIINGNIKTNDGRYYNVDFSKSFIYGTIKEKFILEEFIVPSNNKNNAPIILTFNKPVNLYSFENTFSISPFINTTKEFSNNNQTVTIFPSQKWNTNKTYTAKIENLVSEDNSIITNPQEKNFTPLSINYQPELLSVNTATINNLQKLKYSLNNSTLESNELSNVKISDSLIFNFDKEIDLTSFKNGFSIQPSIAGDFIKSGNSILFIPQSNFLIKTKYTVQLSKSIKDLNEMNVSSNLVFYFTPSNDYLYIQSVGLNDEPNLLPNSIHYNDSPIPEITVSKSNKIFVQINFSKPISKECSKHIDKIISIQPFFPKDLKWPVLTSIQISENFQNIIYEFENISIPENSTPKENTFYKLTIKSSKEYLFSEEKEYLKEDECIIFKTK